MDTSVATAQAGRRAVSEGRKKLILITGSGRSGTSAVSEILIELGCRFLDDFLAANDSNPRGFFESKRILDLHKGLLKTFDADIVYPLPEGWRDDQATLEVIAELCEIVAAELESRDIWAVKDPRISILWPVWQAVADQLDLEIKTIICVRNPSAVSESLERWEHTNQVSEIIWLFRLSEIVARYGRAAFVMHYEDLIESPDRFVKEIAAFGGLKPTSEGLTAAAACVDPALNRSTRGFEPGDLHETTNTFYASLQTVGGADGNRDDLVGRANEIRNQFKLFKPWFFQYRDNERAQSDTRYENLKNRLDEVKKDRKKISWKSGKEVRTLTKRLQNMQVRLSDLKSDLRRAENRYCTSQMKVKIFQKKVGTLENQIAVVEAMGVVDHLHYAMRHFGRRTLRKLVLFWIKRRIAAAKFQGTGTYRSE